jgi:hypothetical protein
VYLSLDEKEKEWKLLFSFQIKRKPSYFRLLLTQLVFLVGQETLRPDVSMSVVTVFRQSYYLVVDVQSKTTIEVSSLVVVSSPLSLDPVMHCRAFFN